MEDEKVTIIIPVIRQENLAELIPNIWATIGIPKERVDLIVETDEQPFIGCPKMVKMLVEKVQTDLVCFIGDDTDPQMDFLKFALEDMKTLPEGYGVVGIPDELERDTPIHWLASKKILTMLDGEFFHTGYIHNYCDNELKTRAEQLCRYTTSRKARIHHPGHPAVHNLALVHDASEIIRRILGFGRNMRHDFALYHRRALNDWVTPDKKNLVAAIGLPIEDDLTPNEFWFSFIDNIKFPFDLFIPRFPSSNTCIDDIRNDLVIQSLMKGITHLLMMDTDQIYPGDTALRLFNHFRNNTVGDEVWAINGMVHRRWIPFDPILVRVENEGTKEERSWHVPEEEFYSDKLVEVDRTGCGCIIYDMDAFVEIDYPWFRQEKKETGEPIGEDFGMCKKIRNKGKKILVDTALPIGHVTKLQVTKATHTIFKKISGFTWDEPPEGYKPRYYENKKEV